MKKQLCVFTILFCTPYGTVMNLARISTQEALIDSMRKIQSKGNILLQIKLFSYTSLSGNLMSDLETFKQKAHCEFQELKLNEGDLEDEEKKFALKEEFIIRKREAKLASALCNITLRKSRAFHEKLVLASAALEKERHHEHDSDMQQKSLPQWKRGKMQGGMHRGGGSERVQFL